MPDMIPQVGRSSLVRGMCRSICIMFSGMVSSSGFQSRFFVLANEEIVHRTRGHAFHVRPENPKCARIRTLSSKCVKSGHYHILAIVVLR